MSIINQTLRELDARKRAAASPIALRAVAAVPRQRRTALWGAAAALLGVAGAAGWIASATDEGAPRTPAATPRVAPLRTAAPARPVAPPAQAPAAARAAVVATASPAGLAAAQDGAAAPAPMAAPPAVVDAPAIRKEMNPATALDEADERYRKAVALVQKGRENQARPLLEEAIGLAPAHVGARQMLATLLSEAGRDQEAETVLRAGLAAIPDNAWFALGLARLLAARGETEAAAAILSNGIDGHGVNAEYRATLAALLLRLKRHAEAGRQYELALRSQPEQGTWWVGLGLALEEQDKTEAARAAFGRALAAENLPEKLAEFVRAKLAD